MNARMNSNRLTRSLLTIVGVGWGALAIAATLLKTVLATPDVTLLVDRSYCEPDKWAAIATDYDQLYQQHRRGQVNLKAVILFSDLGEETLETPPSPADFAALSTYGRPARDRQAALLSTHANAQLLTCTP